MSPKQIADKLEGDGEDVLFSGWLCRTKTGTLWHGWWTRTLNCEGKSSVSGRRDVTFVRVTSWITSCPTGLCTLMIASALGISRWSSWRGRYAAPTGCTFFFFNGPIWWKIHFTNVFTSFFVPPITKHSLKDILKGIHLWCHKQDQYLHDNKSSLIVPRWLRVETASWPPCFYPLPNLYKYNKASVLAASKNKMIITMSGCSIEWKMSIM